MLALYPPPQHLRGDANKQAAALAAYAVALAGFDDPTLAAGWKVVTAEHQFWVWPQPRHRRRGVPAVRTRRRLPR